MSDPRTYLESNRKRFLEELFELLRIPSVSADSTKADEVRRCAEMVAQLLDSAGLERVEVLPTPGHPVVYGEWLSAPGQPTVLIYGHYDVQPADPVELWTSPPFEPTIRDGDLYARGSMDDKGQLLIHVKAVEAHLRTNGRLPVNVKFLIEGEEEVGSAHLDEFIAANRDLLKADVAVISDTAMFKAGVPSLCYGLRGLTYLQVEVVGPKSDLHSGSFGGSVLNPIQALCELIAGLKDQAGRITVSGFYDQVRPLTEEERAEFGRLPFDEAEFRSETGVPALYGEAGFTTLERLWARPTLELNGIWGGYTGEGAKTVLPAKAAAKISCRLVPDQDPQQITELLRRHLEASCPPGVTLSIAPLHGGKPSLTPIDHPAVRAAARAVERGFGKRAVFQREGGSIPVVATLDELLGLPTVLMGIGLPNGNAHAPDERLHLDNFYGGLLSAAYLLEELAAPSERV
ncbi:MAG: dipeptidase [Chloroflexi bacterium]|nr:dipeptidase [Chloroflexota bacterium]